MTYGFIYWCVFAGNKILDNPISKHPCKCKTLESDGYQDNKE